MSRLLEETNNHSLTNPTTIGPVTDPTAEGGMMGAMWQGQLE